MPPHASRQTVRSWGTVALFTVCTALMFILTKTATGPHHSAVLSGLWQLVLVPPLVALSGTVQGRLPAQIAVTIAAAGMLATTAATVRCFVEEKPRPNWDQANWQLGLHIAAHPNERFVIVDWGMGNQVVAATCHTGDFADQWPSFTDVRSAKNQVQREATRGVCNYVSRC